MPTTTQFLSDLIERAATTHLARQGLWMEPQSVTVSVGCRKVAELDCSTILNIWRTVVNFLSLIRNGLLSLAILSIVVIQPYQASADTVSHTDCSRGYSTNATRQSNRQWRQTTYGGVFNFSPGVNGYSPMTGLVPCDTRTHQVYLYLKNIGDTSWRYSKGDTAFNGESVFVVAYEECGVLPVCRSIRYQYLESGFIWDEEIYFE